MSDISLLPTLLTHKPEMLKTGGHLIMQTTGVVEQSIRRGINEKTSLG